MKMKLKYYYGGILWLQNIPGIPAAGYELTAQAKNPQFYNIINSAINTAYYLQIRNAGDMSNFRMLNIK